MLPRNRIDVKRLAKDTPDWVRKAVEGRNLMRNGIDYKNTNHRYDKAHALFQEAYEEGKALNASQLDLARISLWDGISINENMDIKDHVERNDAAIASYKRGLKHARRVHDSAVISVSASLHNSLGVAYHHRAGKQIPKVAFKHYKVSRDIFRAHPDLRRQLIRVMKKVESNTGHRVLRGGSTNQRPNTDANPFFGGNCAI